MNEIYFEIERGRMPEKYHPVLDPGRDGKWLGLDSRKGRVEILDRVFHLDSAPGK